MSQPDPNLSLEAAPAPAPDPGPSPAASSTSRGGGSFWNRPQRLRDSRLLASLTEQWPWAVLVTLGFAIVGFAWGYVSADYSAAVHVAVSRPYASEGPAADDAGALRPEFFFERLVNELRSPEFLRQVAVPGLTPSALATLRERATVEADARAGVLVLRVRAPERQTAVRLVNAYATRAEACLRDRWAEAMADARAALEKKAASIETEIEAVQRELDVLRREHGLVDAARELTEGQQRQADLEARLQTARAQLDAGRARARALAEELKKQSPALVSTREALNQALVQFTEEHPRVKALRAALAQLEAEQDRPEGPLVAGLSAGTNALSAGLYLQFVEARAAESALEQECKSLTRARDELQSRLLALARAEQESARLTTTLESLKERRAALVRQQHGLGLRAQENTTCNRIVDLARVENASRLEKWKAGLACGSLAGLGGGLVFLLLALGLETGERTIRSEDELAEITQLPVLASLGDLEKMDGAQRQRWAFETLAILKARLARAGTPGLLCGFISSGPGEGRSTWVRLLAEAARRQGYHVLTVLRDDSAPRTSEAAETGAADGPTCALPLTPLAQSEEWMQTVSAARPPTCGSIPLADWIWDWQHRDQFQRALTKWRMIENLAFFVELPPYSSAEGVMMAGHLPHVVWLCAQGRAGRARTRTQVAALRASRCPLLGAVMNRPPPARARRGHGALAALLLLVGAWSGAVSAQETNPAPVAPSGSLSALSPEQLADWQKHLTLGPGDVLDVSLFGQPDSARSGLVIGPDGRINYLQARDVMAAGLTVDELRAELEKVLSKYILSPQVFINPTAYRSKKYYLLGNVNAKGVYPLDRPTTIVEAIAKARGFASAQHTHNVHLLVDLERSFLVRRGPDGAFARTPVDFEKLFLHGDLSQNLPLAPDDHLFFPPVGVQEVYVVGEVRAPGPVPFTKDLTVIGAIAARAGYTERAWKSKVLVIRGSLTRPTPFVVNLADVLKARGPDFRLENRDIVFVSKRPFARGEEMLEAAVLDFARAAIIGYTGAHVGPFIKEPIIK